MARDPNGKGVQDGGDFLKKEILKAQLQMTPTRKIVG